MQQNLKNLKENKKKHKKIKICNMHKNLTMINTWKKTAQDLERHETRTQLVPVAFQFVWRLKTGLEKVTKVTVVRGKKIRCSRFTNDIVLLGKTKNLLDEILNCMNLLLE